MSDPRNDDTNASTRQPSFEDLESEEARTTSEEAMAPNAVAAAQGGTAMPTSGGPAAIVPAAPGAVLNVGDGRTGDSVGDREGSGGESILIAGDPGDPGDLGGSDGGSDGDANGGSNGDPMRDEGASTDPAGGSNRTDAG